MQPDKYNPLLFDGIEHYIQATPNENTRDYYEKKANIIRRFCRNVPVSEIGRELVIDFIEARLKEMPDGRSTCRKEVQLIGYVQNFYGFPKNWVAPKHYFTGTKKRIPYMPTDEEVREIWLECDYQSRAVIASCIFGGLRKTELSRLKRCHVDEANGVLDIPTEVRKKDRPNRLPLAATLYGALNRAGCLGWRGADEPLFRFINADTLSRRIKGAAKRAGVGGIIGGVQVFRRVLLRWLTEMGYAESERCMITGHKPTNSASIYADNPEGYFEVKRNMLLALEGKWREVVNGAE